MAFTEKESPVISNVQSPLLKVYISIKVANISTHSMTDSGADISCARPEVLPKYHLQSKCNLHTDVPYIKLVETVAKTEAVQRDRAQGVMLQISKKGRYPKELKKNLQVTRRTTVIGQILIGVSQEVPHKNKNESLRQTCLSQGQQNENGTTFGHSIGNLEAAFVLKNNFSLKQYQVQIASTVKCICPYQEITHRCAYQGRAEESATGTPRRHSWKLGHYRHSG